MGESMRKERRRRRSPSDEDNDGSGLRLLRRSLRRSGDGSSRRERRRRRSRSGGGGRSSDEDGSDHSDSGSDDRVGRRKGSYRDVTEEEIVEYMAKKARGNERLRISSTGFGITWDKKIERYLQQIFSSTEKKTARVRVNTVG